MFDETDSFNSGFRNDEFRLRKEGEPTGSIYFTQGPRRIVEYPGVKADHLINKHQEKITHNDDCRCKQYEFNDLVVMYEHIEQYPQFRCYCEFCIKLLMMQCDKEIKDEDANHNIRFQLAGELRITKGIDLR